MRELGGLALIVERQDTAVYGVLQGEQPGLREMHILRLDGARNAPEGDRAVGLVLQGLRLNAAEHGCAALLVFVGVRVLANQVFVAAGAMCHQRRKIALGSGHEEQRALEAEAFSGDRLQAVDRRIITIDIVADLRRSHRRAHCGGRAGHCVAAQVDIDGGCVASESE